MKTITCLIIDDDEQSRDRLESLLQMLNEIEVVAKIGDPDEAVKEIIYHEPALVFIDVEMPRKSGFDVVKEVREAGFFPTFIFATGFNQYAIKALKNAAFDYLLKPIDMDELNDAIERFKAQKNLTAKTEAGKKEDDEKAGVCLSQREKEIIRLIVQGKTSKEIARQLFISKNTVDTHRRNILDKTGLKSTAELINYAHQHKLN